MTMLEHALAKGPRWMPLVVLLCGLLSTLGAWYALSAIQEKAADREFQQLGNEVLEAIEKAPDVHLFRLGSRRACNAFFRRAVREGGVFLPESGA